MERGSNPQGPGARRQLQRARPQAPQEGRSPPDPPDPPHPAPSDPAPASGSAVGGSGVSWRWWIGWGAAGRCWGPVLWLWHPCGVPCCAWLLLLRRGVDRDRRRRRPRRPRRPAAGPAGHRRDRRSVLARASGAGPLIRGPPPRWGLHSGLRHVADLLAQALCWAAFWGQAEKCNWLTPQSGRDEPSSALVARKMRS